MKPFHKTMLVGSLALSVAAMPSHLHAQDNSGNFEALVFEASHATVTMTEDGVARIGWTRDDVEVMVDGMRLDPPAGLGSWAAFKPVDGGVMVMGDTVVFEDEITAAMDAALANGLSVTALHNHFIFDDPPVYFMHIGGHGETARMAAGVKAVWDAIKEVRAASPTPRRSFGGTTPAADGTINAAPLSDTLGAEPSIGDGVVKYTFARQGRMHGIDIGGSMGLTTWAAFSGTDDLAAVDGDFIMTEDEVQPVLRALRQKGIHIVALHNHMIGGEPMFYFLHYWGVGPAKELAAAIAAARNAQAEPG
ncbi:DUF1259 domain-containing protein [Croceicoccus marinus]|jgi:hypothetical protein|nr:DUF1259 domain-containing protein [Croceicoccus marinus]